MTKIEISRYGGRRQIHLHRIVIDGVEPTGDDRPNIRVSNRSGLPWAGVWVDDVPTYDVEVWVYGKLTAKVPPRSPEVEANYDSLEHAA